MEHNNTQNVEIDLEPTSGVQDELVPERVVDGLPTMYCFETCPFCFKVKALLGSRGIAVSYTHLTLPTSSRV